MNKKALTMIGVSIATAFIISTIYLFMTKEEVSVSQKPETTEDVDVQQREAEEDVQNEQGENVIPTEAEESEILYNVDGSIDTSNWQTYRNEEYGFEIMYAEDWFCGGTSLEPDNDKAIFCSLEKFKNEYYTKEEQIGGVMINVVSIESNVKYKDSSGIIAETIRGSEMNLQFIYYPFDEFSEEKTFYKMIEATEFLK